jgi:hypothetical protein
MDVLQLPLLYTSRDPAQTKAIVTALINYNREHLELEEAYHNREEKLFHVVLFDSQARKALYLRLWRTTINDEKAVLIIPTAGAHSLYADFSLVESINEWEKTK